MDNPAWRFTAGRSVDELVDKSRSGYTRGIRRARTLHHQFGGEAEDTHVTLAGFKGEPFRVG